MSELSPFVESAVSIIWGPWLIVLLMGTHLFLTWRTGLIQRRLLVAIRLSLAKDRDAPGDVSHFGALATALAATVGAGNIVGVAVAIGAGGPGAVFWMWLTGVFGISTKFGEALLAVKYRRRNARGEMTGGPMIVIEDGLQARWLGVGFAVLTAIAAFGLGNMFQADSVATQFIGIFPGVEAGMVRTWTGVLLAVAVGAVLIGGIKSIARLCSFLIPFMVVLYLLGCLAVLVINAGQIPSAFMLILGDAFSGNAMAGGALGAVIQAGIRRGLFSNESGLGSAPIAAAAARTSDPVRQALVSMTGTFWDTVVVCAVTGLVLVSSGAWESGETGAAMTLAAFSQIPVIGGWVLTLCLLTFVFSTLLGWSYYGEKSVEYLGGTRLILLYRWLWISAIYIGATLPSDLVVNFADAANGLMAVPNLISLIFLSGVIAAESRRYFSQSEGT